MGCYNILGDNEGSISHILWLDIITAGYILLTVKLVALKSGNCEPILTVKRTEWRKFIDYLCLSIEADASRAGKKNIYFVHIGCILRTSSAKLHISRHHRYKDFISSPLNLCLYQLTKILLLRLCRGW